MGRSYKRSVCRSEKPEADGPTPSRPTSAALDEPDKLLPSQGGDCGFKSRTRYIIFFYERGVVLRKASLLLFQGGAQ